MADADEDAIIPAANASDINLDDETQDFRFLSSLTSSLDPTQATLPRRGEKDFEPHLTQVQSNALSASRSAMHAAISAPRVHSHKTYVRATFDAETGGAWVEKIRGPHFRTVGRTRSGKVWLLPEEALFLLDRGSLDIRWPQDNSGDNPTHASGGKSESLSDLSASDDETVPLGEYKIGDEESSISDPQDNGTIPMSLQAAYAVFTQPERVPPGSALTLEKYTVYASLKRAGYIVLRAPCWEAPGGPKFETPLGGCSAPQPSQSASLFSSTWQLLLATVERSTRPAGEALAAGPLVAPGLYRSYHDIYRRLIVVPSHDPSQANSASPRKAETNCEERLSVTYYVYKPQPTFRKSAPGPPDFYVSVLSARSQNVPELSAVVSLLDQTPQTIPPQPQAQMYQRLKQGYRNVILAVVDQGVVSYMRVADAGFSTIRLWDRKPSRGNKGAGRGVRRGILKRSS
ncbi:tRNA-splicing endonuclease subunit sen54 N-term-domain-containing protein [Lineolata rhizophorae]|uniref:tRNA-splicing endonuclease subunit sen54 N-term-domain-containing protein n=1 Tax=Lineolata rhizophorae TaxID=578093 RepID=A0A6A6NYW5_9PEZI|nr:tRNA-splicing endonuclease subunit sen54 N-term-domain-containing protein [Lineolata rhizophorae]